MQSLPKQLVLCTKSWPSARWEGWPTFWGTSSPTTPNPFGNCWMSFLCWPQCFLMVTSVWSKCSQYTLVEFKSASIYWLFNMRSALLSIQKKYPVLCMCIINRWTAVRESMWLRTKAKAIINGMRITRKNFLEALQDEKDFWRGRGKIGTNGLRVLLWEPPWKFLSGLPPFPVVCSAMSFSEQRSPRHVRAQTGLSMGHKAVCRVS